MVEPKASGKSVVQEIKKTELNIYELPPPKDDKTTRVSSVSAQIEAGKVILVDGQWNDNFLGECAAFPMGEHDDQVDNLVNAIQQANRSVNIVIIWKFVYLVMVRKIVIEVEHDGPLTDKVICEALRAALVAKEKEKSLKLTPAKWN